MKLSGNGEVQPGPICHGLAKYEVDTNPMKRVLLLLSVLLMVIGVILPSHGSALALAFGESKTIAWQDAEADDGACAAQSEPPHIALKSCGKDQGKHALPCGPERCVLTSSWAPAPMVAARIRPWTDPTTLVGISNEPHVRPPRA